MIHGMLLPPPQRDDLAPRLFATTMILFGVACLIYGLTACAGSAPPAVLRADVARVVHAKAKLIAGPTPERAEAALAAKATLVLDLCCYEADAGAAPTDAGDAHP
jgi:hypothetical protein